MDHNWQYTVAPVPVSKETEGEVDLRTLPYRNDAEQIMVMDIARYLQPDLDLALIFVKDFSDIHLKSLTIFSV